ncbi:hypothetical protein SAY87_015076 [Trapa incisa]|uniref:Uncharacterized protein n=1 Tax=Trapa incisa TaxID=236973 RepID=A0AAN7GL34_9MYRT|nr:hypothetical protein SAY87_015076 [Trapa incisa]
MATSARFLLVHTLVAAICSETSSAQTISNVPMSCLIACKSASTQSNPPSSTASCFSALSQA